MRRSRGRTAEPGPTGSDKQIRADDHGGPGSDSSYILRPGGHKEFRMLPRLHPTRTTTMNLTSARASLTTLGHDRSGALIRAVGEWDLANAHLLAEQLEAHENAGYRFVRLDLSAVSFLDCTCLEVLVAAHHRLVAAHRTLVLTGVTPRLTRLLNLAGLDQVLLSTALSDLDARPDHAPARRDVVRPIGRPA